MATLHLICGIICSGKTHYAAKLTQGGAAVPLGLDELTLAIFPEYMGEENAARAFDAAKQYLLVKAEQVLAAGCDAVLDWGFWKEAERRDVRESFETLGHTVQLHYLKVTAEGRRQRLAAREAELLAGGGSYHADEGLLAVRDPLFEEPGEAQCDVILLDGVRVK